MIVGIT